MGTKGTKDAKKLAIEYLKKGYKYVARDNCYITLWKNRPTYQRVHIGSNDDSCMASIYMWVNTDDNTDDYFGVPESDASIFFSEKDPCLIKPLFEIASGGFSEHIIDCINFTDDEIEWILEHLDNYDGIDGILVEKVSTPHPNTDALVVTAFHSSSCVETKESIAISRLSCMFETLDYYTKYVISESEIQKVIAKGVWYTKHAKD